MRILILWLLFSSAAYAEGIAILKSANIQNYNDAVVAFKTNCGAPIAEFDLAKDPANGAAAADEIKALQPDLVFVVGKIAAVAAKKYLGDKFPLVYSVVVAPEKYGLNDQNSAGVLMDVPVSTEMQAIKGIMPNIRKLGALYNPKKTQTIIDEAKAAAAKSGIELATGRVGSKADTIYALKGFAAGIDALWLIPDPTVVNRESMSTVLQYSFENRIPVFAFHKKFVKAGVLLSLSPSYAKMGEQACGIAKKVQGGSSPGTIGAQSPENLEIAVNVKTARSLNLQDISMNAFGFAASRGYKIEALQ